MSVPSLFSLEGKVALVTGASSGLGVTFASSLAEAGADVVLAARRADRLEAVAETIRATGRRALPVSCDVTDPEQVEEAVAQAVAELGRIDVLVANAGAVPEGFAMPEKLPPALFAQSIDVNLNGTWNTCQSAGRRMLEQGSGSIVIVSSYTGLAGVPHFPPAYQAAKAALINVSKSLAVSWADRGVRVNALAPGWFPSEMTEPFFQIPGFYDSILVQQPTGRIGRPDELAGPLLFLASDAASYVSGHTLVVDGGMSAGFGASRHPEELKATFAQVIPHGLGERIMPSA